jgi:hypothetical protein
MTITHIRIFVWFFIWAISFSSYGLETFCFNQSVSLDEVKSYLSPIILPQDKIGKRELTNCLEVETSHERASLFGAYLGKRYSLVQNHHQQKSCRIRVESESVSSDRDINVRVGAKSRVRAYDGQGKGISQSELTILQGKFGTLRYEDQSYFISCVERGSGQYEVEVYLNMGSSDVITTLSLAKNQKTEIGNYIKKYNDDKKGISSRKGISYKKDSVKESGAFYITIL